MRRKFSSLAILLFSLFLVLPAITAQSKAVDAEGHPWWKHAVFQEIYPRSYMDSNNDGIGDLNGIASKMEYLKWLGVDAIWIAPCFPSPQVDFGYDVSDYENIDPMYGTLADFDKMEKIGKQNGIGIVFDFVVNHTSDKHKWFIESSSSKTNPYHDWYIWKDPKGKSGLPNNWNSTFGGSAWQWNPTLNQFYYHFFYPQQPDLNWRNPKVANAMYDSTRFWYKRGVVGFRLDAVDTLFEDPNLTNNPTLPGKNEFGDQNQERKYNDKLPEVHDVMKGLRKTADQYNAVLIGETWTSDVSELKDYYGTKHDELQMPMDLMFTGLKPLSADVFRKHVGAVDASGEWPVWVMSKLNPRVSRLRHAQLLRRLRFSIWAGNRLNPQLRRFGVLVEVDGCYAVGQPLAVGRNGGIAQPLHLHQILEGHGALGGRGLGWAKRGEDEGECERETNRDFTHVFFLFARRKDGFSAKKKFTPRMDWFVRGRVKFQFPHLFPTNVSAYRPR